MNRRIFAKFFLLFTNLLALNYLKHPCKNNFHLTIELMNLINFYHCNFTKLSNKLNLLFFFEIQPRIMIILAHFN